MFQTINFLFLFLARNGFLWYEMIPVILINPMFVVNNGLRFPKRPRRR